jgi:quercetin dioxygenase-like cupin family protein
MGNRPGIVNFAMKNLSAQWLLFVAILIAATVALEVSAVGIQTIPQMRLTPTEINSGSGDDKAAGGAGAAGVRTKVLAGDPSAAGLYTILLFVPAHTTIQAHSHRDGRVATVVSGDWRFGYGDHFDASALKTLPAGSVYSEPAGDYHFAQTEGTAAVVQISGYGPTDTHYFAAENDPRSHR